jgi:hypothetical protein
MRKRKMKNLVKLSVAVWTLASMSASAATGSMVTTVERFLTIAGDRYGGCMAELAHPIASQGLDCRGNWVTFSCSGDFASQKDAQRNLEMAQFAFALEKQVRVYIDDSFTHNTYCFANRIDLLN